MSDTKFLLNQFELIMKSLDSNQESRSNSFQDLISLIKIHGSAIAVLLELCSEIFKPFLKTDSHQIGALLAQSIKNFAHLNLKLCLPNLMKFYIKIFSDSELIEAGYETKVTTFQAVWQEMQLIFHEIKEKMMQESKIVEKIENLFLFFKYAKVSNLERSILLDKAKSLKDWVATKKRVVPKSIDFTPVPVSERKDIPISVPVPIIPTNQKSQEKIPKIVSFSDNDLRSKEISSSDTEPIDQPQITKKYTSIRNKSSDVSRKEPKLETLHQKISFTSKTDLKLRTSLYHMETLATDENIETEYKEYEYPFSSGNKTVLTATICSFLNKRGGRLYIGVDDTKKVKGIFLTESKKTELCQTVNSMTKFIFPDLSKNDVIVQFLPVKDRKTGLMIENCFVAKIIVRQGIRTKVYCVESGDKLGCYIRLDGLKKSLGCDDVHNLVMKRAKGILEDEVDPQDFEDPNPEL